MEKGGLLDKAQQEPLSTTSLFLWMTKEMSYRYEDLKNFSISDIKSLNAIWYYEQIKAEKLANRDNSKTTKKTKKTKDLFSSDFNSLL